MTFRSKIDIDIRGRQGDRETGRQGDRKTGRQGDRETGRQGDKDTAGRQGYREKDTETSKEYIVKEIPHDYLRKICIIISGRNNNKRSS